MILHKLQKAHLIHPPKWVVENCIYLAEAGSNSYGVSSQNSDLDYVGICMPPKHMVFPHLNGEIVGFGRHPERFQQWQELHVKSPDSIAEYDMTVYGIVRYFQLVMEGNPNMVDSLFTPHRCVIHATPISEMIREHRKEFLHKGMWHKFKGYAYSQKNKIFNKQNASNPKRAESIEKFGYDTKFAYHLVRLLNEIEQIMVEHDLDLERNREQLKAIRRGEWSLDYLNKYFDEKEHSLEAVYSASTLRHGPDEEKIKQLLLSSLEMFYGDLSSAVRIVGKEEYILREVAKLVKDFA